jgi:cysteine desulfurase
LREKAVYLAKLRDLLVAGIREKVPNVFYTGHPEKRLPGHASFCFEGIEGEALVYRLSSQGIYANTGSACASKALKTSPVLGAIGIPPEVAQGSLVFTLSQDNRDDEVSHVLVHLPPEVEKLRSISPVWRKKMAASAGA